MAEYNHDDLNFGPVKKLNEIEALPGAEQAVDFSAAQTFQDIAVLLPAEGLQGSQEVYTYEKLSSQLEEIAQLFQSPETLTELQFQQAYACLPFITNTSNLRKTLRRIIDTFKAPQVDIHTAKIVEQKFENNFSQHTIPLNTASVLEGQLQLRKLEKIKDSESFEVNENSTEAHILGSAEQDPTVPNSIETFQPFFGRSITAVCDVGIGPREKKENEDRIVVAEKENFIAVIDGVGGAQGGAIAAQAFAEALQQTTQVEQAILATQKKLAAEDLLSAAACYITGKIVFNSENQPQLEIFQQGDCKIIIFGHKGELKFESKDQTYAQYLVDMGKTPAEAANYRNYVLSALSHDSSTPQPYKAFSQYKTLNLEPGDTIILCSDGVTDNLTTAEIQERLLESGSGTEKTESILRIVRQRMSNLKRMACVPQEQPDGTVKYVDASGETFQQKSKQDNISFVLYEI